MWNFVKDEVYVLPVPITLNNFKNQQRITAKTEQQSVWYQVKYHLEVCRAQITAYT